MEISPEKRIDRNLFRVNGVKSGTRIRQFAKDQIVGGFIVGGNSILFPVAACGSVGDPRPTMRQDCNSRGQSFPQEWSQPAYLCSPTH